MNDQTFLSDLISELKSRGYAAKQDGHLVTFDINPDIGECRTYTIERVDKMWQVNLTEIDYSGHKDGDYDEEQTVIGDYTTITAIADSIDDHEENY